MRAQRGLWALLAHVLLGCLDAPSWHRDSRHPTLRTSPSIDGRKPSIPTFGGLAEFHDAGVTDGLVRATRMACESVRVSR